MVTETGVRFRVGFMAVVFAWSGLRIATQMAGATHDPVLSPLRAAGLGSIVVPVLTLILALDVMSLVILMRRKGSAAWLIADVFVSWGFTAAWALASLAHPNLLREAVVAQASEAGAESGAAVASAISSPAVLVALLVAMSAWSLALSLVAWKLQPALLASAEPRIPPSSSPASPSPQAAALACTGLAAGLVAVAAAASALAAARVADMPDAPASFMALASLTVGAALMAAVLHRRARSQMQDQSNLQPLHLAAGFGARLGILAVIGMLLGWAWIAASAGVAME